MTKDDVEETRASIKKVTRKYGKNSTDAKELLTKMGYLTKSGKVARAYAAPRKKAGAA